jgi:hypothetical protein
MFGLIFKKLIFQEGTSSWSKNNLVDQIFHANYIAFGMANWKIIGLYSGRGFGGLND